MKKLNILSSWLFLMLSVLFIGSCKKEATDTVEFSRMFSPGTVDGSTSGQTEIKISWNPSLYSSGPVQYQVELSKNQAFSTVDYAVTTDTSTVTITEVNIALRTPYYVRIKAKGTGKSEDSKWFTGAQTIQLTGEQIFKPMVSSEILDKAVLLRWNATPNIVKIVITPQGGTAIEIPITAGDNTAAFKIIPNLIANKAYTAEIFSSTKSKGFLSFTTKASLVAFNIVDLRPITGRPSVLADTLPVIPAGSTVLLKRGETYNITSAIAAIGKTVTLMSGDDFIPAQANLYLTSNFNFAAGSTTDSLVFRDLSIKGENATRYVFNTTNGATLNKLVFDGCSISTFRGVARFQSGATTINDVNVTNCVIDNIADFGVVNADNASVTVKNILMKNSTVYKAQKVIVSKQNSVSVTIDNCTFNEAPFGNNYLIDYSTSPTNNVTGGIKISNSIVGIGLSNAGNNAVRGIRVNAATNIAVANTYKTADYVPAVTNPAAIPNLLSYAGNSTDLWKEPLTGNFAFKDNTFSGKATAGDPRWR